MSINCVTKNHDQPNWQLSVVSLTLRLSLWWLSSFRTGCMFVWRVGGGHFNNNCVVRHLISVGICWPYKMVYNVLNFVYIILLCFSESKPAYRSSLYYDRRFGSKMASGPWLWISGNRSSTAPPTHLLMRHLFYINENNSNNLLLENDLLLFCTSEIRSVIHCDVTCSKSRDIAVFPGGALWYHSWSSCRPNGYQVGKQGGVVGRLLQSPSLVAVGLSVRYETWPPIGCHHPVVIGSSKCNIRLGMPQSQSVLCSGDRWKFLPSFNATDRGLTVSLHSTNSTKMPAVRAVQGDCETVLSGRPIVAEGHAYSHTTSMKSAHRGSDIICRLDIIIVT